MIFFMSFSFFAKKRAFLLNVSHLKWYSLGYCLLIHSRRKRIKWKKCIAKDRQSRKRDENWWWKKIPNVYYTPAMYKSTNDDDERVSERERERDCEHLHRRLIKFHIEHLHVFKLRSKISISNTFLCVYYYNRGTQKTTSIHTIKKKNEYECASEEWTVVVVVSLSHWLHFILIIKCITLLWVTPTATQIPFSQYKCKKGWSFETKQKKNCLYCRNCNFMAYYFQFPTLFISLLFLSDNFHCFLTRYLFFFLTPLHSLRAWLIASSI